MKAYIESLLNEALEQFVEEFHSTSLNVGLWEGDVKLLNLILKRRRFDLGKGVTLSIEYGSIECAQLTIPWTKLGSGGLKASIDKLSLVCRLYLRNEGDDETNENEVEAYERKMRSLSMQELKQLGISGDQAWWNQWISSWATSIFSRIASGFELSLTNVSVSIMMDVVRDFSGEGQQPPTSVVRICIPAIDIRPPTAVTHDTVSHTATSAQAPKPVHADQQDSIDRLFSKDINIRGLTLSVNSISNDDAIRFSQNYSLLAQFVLTDVLLNPLNFTCSSSSQSRAVTTTRGATATGEKSGHRSIRHDDMRARDAVNSKKQSSRQIPSTHQHQHHQVSLHMHFGNTEWSPTISQIIQISDTAFHMRLAMIRRQVAHLRPGIETYSRPIQGRASAALWWKYAIEAIILFNGKKRSMSRKTLEDHISRSVQRKQYIDLYHRAISMHLPSHRSVFRSTSKQLQPTALTEEDKNDLRVLHDWLSETHILQYRAVVLRLLHRQGESMSNLKAAAVAYQEMLLVAAASALQQQRDEEEDDEEEDDEDEDRDYHKRERKKSNITTYSTTLRGLSVLPTLHLALDKEENREIQEAKDLPIADTGLEFSFRVNVCLSRLSLTVLDARDDDDDETDNPAVATDFSTRQQPVSFTEASMRHAAAAGGPHMQSMLHPILPLLYNATATQPYVTISYPTIPTHLILTLSCPMLP